MKVALALGNAEWESDFISVISHPMLNLKVVRRCVDGIDLLAAVQVNEIEVVIVTDETLRLDEHTVSQIHDANVVVIVISNSTDRWTDMGVQKIIGLDHSDLFSVAMQITKVGFQADPMSQLDASANHTFVCVASFGGGVGRSLVAKELGWWSSKQGAQTLVVEGDTYGASLHQELNLPSLSTDLLQLSQLKVSPERNEYELGELAVVEPNLVVVPGISHVSLWPALRRAPLERMWKRLINSGNVIVDVGPVFCSTENLEHELNLTDRDSVAQSAISNARVVVLCAIANTVSVTRLIRGVIDFQDSMRNQEIYVVLNRCRNVKSATELSNLIRRHTGIEQVICLPDDPDALECAELKCDFLGKLQAKHEINRQLSELALEVFQKDHKPLTQIQEQRLQRATAA